MPSTATPYLCVDGAGAALEFYRRAFGAEEVERWTGDDGRVGHAEFRIGSAAFYLADEHPEAGVRGPLALGGTPVSFALLVPDADAVFQRAVDAGATVDRPVAEQAFGERAGWLFDPFGHRWGVMSRTEDLDRDETRRRVSGEYDIT
jgi:PhnB protein